MVVDFYQILLGVLTYPVMLAMALVAGGLQMARLWWPASVRLPGHFRVAKTLGWLLLASFYVYVWAVPPVAVAVAAVAFSRLAILAVLVAEIWVQGWILWQIFKQRQRRPMI